MFKLVVYSQDPNSWYPQTHRRTPGFSNLSAVARRPNLSCSDATDSAQQVAAAPAFAAHLPLASVLASASLWKRRGTDSRIASPPNALPSTFKMALCQRIAPNCIKEASLTAACWLLRLVPHWSSLALKEISVFSSHRSVLAKTFISCLSYLIVWFHGKTFDSDTHAIMIRRLVYPSKYGRMWTRRLNDLVLNDFSCKIFFKLFLETAKVFVQGVWKCLIKGIYHLIKKKFYIPPITFPSDFYEYIGLLSGHCVLFVCIFCLIKNSCFCFFFFFLI